MSQSTCFLLRFLTACYARLRFKPPFGRNNGKFLKGEQFAPVLRIKQAIHPAFNFLRNQRCDLGANRA